MNTTTPLLDMTVRDFLSRLASEAPTPGGGAAAALGGALAAALGEMVCNLTQGKPKFAAVEPQVRGLLARYSRARRMLADLVQEDAAAYASFSAAFKRPRDDAERPEAIRAAAAVAAAVPLETATISRRVASDFALLRTIENTNLAADVEAGAALAQAAIVAAAANVRANLPFVDEKTRVRLEHELAAF
ncbi:MAG: cyclodeaminase/cyclohydrolase family protein [Planctomycetes bacterium]|nr:cyclodeaminase/cyclohydrolase family protein [Planctomycetota bacterium]